MANFVPGNNKPALQGAVFILFCFQFCYSTFLDGTQFSYIDEIFPTHLRAKGVCLGMPMISLMNVIWLMA